MRKRRLKYKRCKRKRCKIRKGQKGGLFPLLAMAIPAAIAASKAAALGAIGTGAGMAVKFIADRAKRRRRK